MDFPRTRVSRRGFLRAAALTTAGATLAACGPKPTPEVITQTQVVQQTVEVIKQVTATPPEPITLRLAHHWGGSREPQLKKACDDFTARNPNIKVEVTLWPWDQKEQLLLAAVAAGDPPEVVHFIGSELASYANEGALQPLDDLIQQAGISPDEAIPTAWQSGIFQEKVWALPLSDGLADQMLFYNTAQFQEAGLDPKTPPKTWAELRQFATKLTQRDANGITRLGVQLGTSGWEWLYYVAQNDAKWLSDDAKQVLMDNDGCVEALQFLVDLANDQGGWQQVQAFTSVQRQTEPFYAGDVSILESGSWHYSMIQSDVPDLPYLSAIAPNNKGKWSQGSYGPQQWALPARDKHPNEAFQLADWLSRGDGGCQFTIARGVPSSWVACNEASPLASVAPYWPAIMAAVDSCRPEPLTPVFNQFLATWDDMIQKALLGRATAADAIKEGTEQMIKINDEYWAKHS